MIKEKLKPGKITAVVFLTVLIWVWADLTLDELMPVSAAISVANTNPKLWITFENGLTESIDEIILKGPAARLAELRRKLKRTGALRFEFDTLEARAEKTDEPYRLELLPLIQKDKQIKQHGLKVEFCKPETLLVKTVALTKRNLRVECFDEDHTPVTATVVPPKVEMTIPEDSGVPYAEVLLTPMEIEQARTSPVYKTPFIRVSADQTLPAETRVAIQTPRTLLKDDAISSPRVFYAISPTLQGKYTVKVINETDVLGAIEIQATSEAKQAYMNMPYHAILAIYDEDVGTEPAEKTRALTYNLPPNYRRKGEIKLKRAPVEARFRLIPLKTTPTTQPAPGA
jgi:hypothetical protein